MTLKRLTISILAAAIIVPAIVVAQSATTTGLLNVYVQVLNQSGSIFTPSNFIVSVSGTNAAPSSFAGSLSGTLVSLSPGTYSATVPNLLNYSASYSVGCSGTMFAGVTHTCVITMTPSTSVSTGSTPAPFVPMQPLRCWTDTPVVAVGQTARFTAVGGIGGTYNWATASQNFPNIGPALTTTFMSSGTHSVSVTNATQTATCPITVSASYVAQNPGTPFYPTYPGTTYPTYQNPSYSSYPQPTLTSYAYPRFPSTGLEPMTSAQIALALVMLMGATFLSYPYARKAFAVAVR
jgi:hypothetical protein